MDGLPFISVNISQPGDKGEFLISVSDIKTKQVILTNRLKEDRSAFDYLYNSRLVEGGGMGKALVTGNVTDLVKSERQQDLTRYGQRLYQDLFGRDDTFKRYLAKNPHLAKGACIVLRLYDTASELWNIPWEYIHDGTQFLGLNPKFPILRFLVDTKLGRPMPDMNQLPNPLRILFVISNPKNVPPLNVEAEIHRIRKAIKPAADKNLVEFDYVEQGTLANIENALSKRDFHVLHYSGHGTMSSRGSMLVMENDKGMAELVSLDKLLPIIAKAEHLRLVFLSACKAGNINETLASSGIATGLMKVVPAVVAMQFSILDGSATQLAESFYGNIGRGSTLEEALFTARKTLHAQNDWLGDWGVPALYLHKPNIRLIDASQDQTAEAPPPKAVQSVTPLPNPEPFVGRRDEQNAIRTVLKDATIPFIYIWGMAGVGKSALVHQIIKRPGHDTVINDVLIVRCDQMTISQIMTAFQDWLGKHFPALTKVLDYLHQKPREVIKKIAEHVKDKRLLVVFDHADAIMTVHPTHYASFITPIAEDFFIGLARADWGLTTIVTARLAWHYTSEIPENAFKDIHLNALAPVDVAFITNEREVFKNQPIDVRLPFLNMVGGHAATLDYIAKLLVSKPDLLTDPRLQSALVQYWHKSFLKDMLALLSDSERELLKLMSVHNGDFSPQLVQLYGDLDTREQAAYIMVTWEKLSLADFMAEDDNEVTWYIIPNLVRTYLTSSMDADEKSQLHARFAQVMQESFLETIQVSLEKSGEKRISVQRGEEFTTVLKFLPLFWQHPDPNTSRRYLNLAVTWQKHLRDAGKVAQANLVVVGFIGILHDFGDYTTTDSLIKTVRQSGRLSSELDIQMRYWSAVRLMDERQYAKAATLLDTLETQTRDNEALKRLHAHVLKHKGEIFRGMGDAKRAEKQWIQALDEYEVLRDGLETARILFYFAEQSYYAKDIEKANSRIQKALTVLYNSVKTGPGIQLQGKLILYKGHIARLQNKGADAIDCYSAIIDIGMSIGDGALIGQGLEHMGYYYGLLRQYEIASKKLLQAYDLYEKLDDQTGLSVVLMKLAVIQDFAGNGKEAATFCERSLRIAQQHKLAHLKDVEGLYKRLKRKG